MVINNSIGSRSVHLKDSIVQFALSLPVRLFRRAGQSLVAGRLDDGVKVSSDEGDTAVLEGRLVARIGLTEGLHDSVHAKSVGEVAGAEGGQATHIVLGKRRREGRNTQREVESSVSVKTKIILSTFISRLRVVSHTLSARAIISSV